MDELIACYTPITLDEMKSVKLMNRTDTKFVTTRSQMEQLLEMALADYRMQEIAGERNMEYETIYWDTRDFDMYRMHQHGHAGRQKLRFRTYVSSHLQFMEVKTKNNHGRTKKKRMEVHDMDLSAAEKRDYLAACLHYDVDTLMPTLQNRFRRLTLVNRGMTERLTIDTDLCFNNLLTGRQLQLEPLAIIELKRDSLCPSPVLAMLRRLRIMPHGFSKYCMGSALTNDQLPVNRFKPKLHDIHRIIGTDKV